MPKAPIQQYYSPYQNTCRICAACAGIEEDEEEEEGEDYLGEDLTDFSVKQSLGMIGRGFTSTKKLFQRRSKRLAGYSTHRLARLLLVVRLLDYTFSAKGLLGGLY